MPAEPIDLNTAKNKIEHGIHTEIPLEHPRLCTIQHGPSVDPTNLELADEIEAVNAIYNQTILAAEQASQDGTVRCRFRVPSTHVSLRIVFSSRYPSERPQVAALNVFQRTTSALAQHIHEIVSRTMSDVFIPGVVCMFDILERVREQHRLPPTEPSTPSSSLSSSRPPQIPAQPRPPRPCNHLPDISTLLTTHSCAICLDTLQQPDLVHLSCNHHFCASCLNEGFLIALKSKVPFACCTRLIPLAVLADYTMMPSGTVQRYETFLIERSVKAPLYCSARHCRRFIRPDEGGAGGLVGEDGRVVVGYRGYEVRCPSCKVHTCVYCRRKMHAEGWCRENEQMKKFMERSTVQVCGRCGNAVEKFGGCKNMVCRCGYRWCWICKKERPDDSGCRCGWY